jgi:hypothetical protein
LPYVPVVFNQLFPTRYVYIFHMILRMGNSYFISRIGQLGLCDGDECGVTIDEVWIGNQISLTLRYIQL